MSEYGKLTDQKLKIKIKELKLIQDCGTILVASFLKEDENHSNSSTNICTATFLVDKNTSNNLSWLRFTEIQI